MRAALLLCLLSSATALVAGPLAARRVVTMPAAAGVTMYKCSGGSSPNRNKFHQKSRGSMSKLLYKSDSADAVKENLLSATTERTLVRMNWKVRNSMIHKIKARCSQFDVDFPKSFAAADVRPRNTPKHLLQLTTTL